MFFMIGHIRLCPINSRRAHYTIVKKRGSQLAAGGYRSDGNGPTRLQSIRFPNSRAPCSVLLTITNTIIVATPRRVGWLVYWAKLGRLWGVQIPHYLSREGEIISRLRCLRVHPRSKPHFKGRSQTGPTKVEETHRVRTGTRKLEKKCGQGFPLALRGRIKKINK